MDRKLLFYLLGSIEETNAKLTLREDVQTQLSDITLDKIHDVQKSLEVLRVEVANLYLDLDHENTSDTPGPSVE